MAMTGLLQQLKSMCKKDQCDLSSMESRVLILVISFDQMNSARSEQAWMSVNWAVDGPCRPARQLPSSNADTMAPIATGAMHCMENTSLYTGSNAIEAAC